MLSVVHDCIKFASSIYVYHSIHQGVDMLLFCCSLEINDGTAGHKKVDHKHQELCSSIFRSTILITMNIVRVQFYHVFSTDSQINHPKWKREEPTMDLVSVY